MNRRIRFLLALPVGCAALLFRVASESELLGLLLLALPFVAAVTGWTMSVARARIVLPLLVGALLGGVYGLTSQESLSAGSLGGIGYFLGVTSLSLAGLHLFLDRPWGGAPATLALALLSILSCGTTFTRSVFPLAVLGFLVLAGIALHESDAGRPAWRELRSKHWLAGAGVVIAGLTLATGGLWMVPSLYQRANRWLSGLAVRDRAGFVEGPMRLGSLQDLLLSDEIVLRVFQREEGKESGEKGLEPPGRLRGKVLRDYTRGQWFPLTRPGPILELDTEMALPYSEVEVVGEDVDRFFLPLRVAALETAPSSVVVDEMGVVRSATREAPERVRYRKGERSLLPVKGPEEVDVRVPPELAPVLSELVGSWTAGEKGPFARMRRIEEALKREYEYALDFRRTRGRDPVEQFLLEDRRGHCEYFASAMALLARQAGIPARVATGYRVSEWNPLGEYYIVRERNAHAWTEIWIEDDAGGRWVTFDATPASAFDGGAGGRTPFLAAVFDWSGVLLARGGVWPVLGLLIATLAWLVLRRKLRSQGRTREVVALGYETPPRFVTEFLAQLSASGVDRAPDETLEELAARLEKEARLPEAAGLVRRYSSWRYGSGTDDGLRREMQRWSPAR